ncbi:SusC/RagA family TonB-linked outer membrane protein [Pedobacter sp. ok626]|uniref:SusC/RagA family TonB-linked outer membrane protein n=1 Tax=Pedobacter sp. ok626 TaxID=1761882 RepID=UPI0014055E2D|nr:SusC/RagA family TonB-linked outer membrane protein [Pedobacter sp. ok626]
MRINLISILLIATFLQVSAIGFAQKVTFVSKNATMKVLFSQIYQQTGYSVLMAGKNVKSTDVIAVAFKNTPLEEVIRKSLANRLVTYTIEDQMIVIRDLKMPANPVVPKDTSFLVEGYVVNSQGDPLLGATVKLTSLESSFIGTTDQTGRFRFSAHKGDVLTLTYLGYESKRIKISTANLGSIVLQLKQESLDEVQIVIGYGSTTERLNTGNVAVVNADDIKKQPVTNVLQALQGVVPGLQVNQTNGFSSAPFSVKLRGQNNLAVSGNIGVNSISEPLYVIDGVPLISGSTTGQQNVGINQNSFSGPTGGQSPLYGINPADIESISVLKDADATAIYGARGANGVIIITTKKGQVGGTSIDANVYSGVSLQAKTLNLMNTSQYLEMRKRAFENDNLVPDNGNGYDLTLWDNSRYTDWQKELLGTAHTTDAQLSLSGGAQNTTFRLNGGFNTRTPPFKGNYKEQRGSGMLSINNTAFGERLTTSAMLNFSSTLSNLPSVDPTSLIFLAPNAPALLDANGKPNFEGWNAAGGLPYEALGMQRIYSANTKNLITNLSLKYKLMDGLELSSSMGYSLTRQNQLQKAPASTFAPSSFVQRETTFGANNNSTWLIEPNLNWRRSFGNHHLQVLVGATFQNSSADGSVITARGFTSDALMENIGAATEFSTIGNDYTTRFQSLYSRISYNYNGKYVLNLTGRRDGSSRFASGKQFGDFGSIGAAYIFSDETFFRDHVSWLSMGKIRGSYGVVGSDGLGDYQYLSSYRPGNNPYQGTPTLDLSRLANDQFGWTTNRKAELGLELSFLNGRLATTFSAYRNRSGNQLVAYPLPATAGFSAVVANLPALVQNIGLEFSLRSQNITTDRFSWSSNFNISRNRNKLLEFPGLEESSYAGSYAIGRSISSIGMPKYTGIDPQTGYYTFADVNGDGEVDGFGSKDYIYKDNTPAFFGALTNDFRYGNFQLSLLFSFTKQKGIYRTQNTLPGSLSQGKGNQLILEQQYSGKAPLENLTTGNAGFRSDLFSYYRSDAVWVDASYIRLQNLSLSYNLPVKLGMHALRVYMQGQDLFTITGYKGTDPATPALLSLPPRKILTAGLQLTL